MEKLMQRVLPIAPKRIFLLHLLDRFQAENKEKCKAASWKVDEIKQAEFQWLTGSYDALKDIVKDMGLEIRYCSDDNSIYLHNIEQDDTTLTNEQITSLTTRIENSIDNSSFNFSKQIANMARRTQKVLSEKCKEEVTDIEKIHQVQIIMSPVSGESFMIPYEIGFSGGGNVFTYPDIEHFTEEHKKLWIERSGCKSSRIFIDFFLRGYVSPCHELIHNLQSIARFKDKSSWVFEHDASRVQLVLASYILNQSNNNNNSSTPEKEEELWEGKGLYEQIALRYFELANYLDNEVSEESKEAYINWRNGFGRQHKLTSDAFASFSSTGNDTYYYKTRVSLEAFFPSKLDLLLKEIFKAHNNPETVVEGKYVVPSELVSKFISLQQLASPITAQQLQSVVSLFEQ